MARVLKFTLSRAVALIATVIVGVYLSILIANMGGHVDEIRRGQIREFVALALQGNQEARTLTFEERAMILEDLIAVEEKRLGLDQPFFLRSLTALGQALTLDLGRAQYMTSDSGSRQVRLIILERLAPTLLLFATAELLLFFGSVFIALFLSRRYGSSLGSPHRRAGSHVGGSIVVLRRIPHFDLLRDPCVGSPSAAWCRHPRPRIR